MSSTRDRHNRSSAHPPRSEIQSRSHGQSQSSRAHIRSRSPVPRARRQSRSKGRGRNPKENSPNTLMGRELSRALNKASERGTQGKEMYVITR
jgi:hypothetical protein